MNKSISALYVLARQRGKIVILALVVSLVIAWQTLNILETGWRDRRLLNQRMLAVQTRQAVFSISAAVLRRLVQPGWRKSVLGRLNSGSTLIMCLNVRGELVSRCTDASFAQGVDTSTKIKFMGTPIDDLSGDGWQYLQITSRGVNALQIITESVSVAVNSDNGEIRIQQRYWLNSL